MALLKFFLVVILVYLFIRMLIRQILPIVAQRLLKKYQNQMNNRNFTTNKSEQKVGDITINVETKKRDKLIDKDKGEYIDYEDVVE